MAPTIELYFDFTCPFAYLASTQAAALAARASATLVWKPFLLGGVFQAVGTAQRLFETLSPAKAAHNAADMQRWARRFGVTLRMPEGHPMKSVQALRATLATGVDPAVIAGFFRAYWVDGRAIGEPSVIRDVVTAAGHDAERVLAAIESAAIKDELRARTQEAIDLGIFGAPTWRVGQELFWGQDRMAFVERAARGAAEASEPPSRGAPSKAAASHTLDVYWDFASPFAYLGCARVARLAERTGARVVWHPILLGGLFRSIGTPDAPLLASSPAKQQYLLRDLERWAAEAEVPFRFPSRFPTRSLDALRLYLALPEASRASFRDAVFRAYWGEDRDITDAAVLASCAPDPETFEAARARAQSDEIKAELRAETEAALARGVFGVPTFIVDGTELFWGQDRLELVEAALST